MEEFILPVMVLDPDKQKSLFNQAVFRRYEDLISKVEKSVDPYQKMRMDFNELNLVFNEPKIEPQLIPRIRALRHQEWGSCKEDIWVQIKDIFISRLNGSPYNYSLVDHEDIEALLNLPVPNKPPQLVNQIWTEVYYKYYQYLEEHLKPGKENKPSKKRPEIELDLTEKMLIISYLQDFDKFPANDSSRNRKDYDRFIAILFDVTYETLKNKYKNLERIKSRKLTESQLKPRINNLLKVLDVIKLLKINNLEKAIQDRINQLQ